VSSPKADANEQGHGPRPALCHGHGHGVGVESPEISEGNTPDPRGPRW
jgi:hypothetical protein